MEIKCNQCGKTIIINNLPGSFCMDCGSAYDLKAILRGIVEKEGEDVYQARAKIKGLVMDLCKDASLHPKVFGAIADRGVPAQILAIFKNGGTDFSDLHSLEQKTADAEGADIGRVHDTMAALYYGLSGNLYPSIQVVQQKTQTQKNQSVPTPPISTPSAQKSPSLPTQIAVPYFNKQINIPNWLSSSSVYPHLVKIFSVKQNQYIALGIAGFLLLLILINMISCVACSGNNAPARYTPPPTTTTTTTTTTEPTTTTKYPNLITDKTISGVVRSSDTPATYTFIPEISGTYRFALSNRTSGYDMYMKIYDSNDNRVMDATNEGTQWLEKSMVYTLQVACSNDNASYTLSILDPNETSVLTAENNSIHSAVKFEGQMNEYTYSATVSGRHRVDCLNRTNGINVSVSVYDANDNRLFRETNGGYLDLQKGTNYSIYVQYDSGACDYDFKLSIPSEIKNIAQDVKTVSDTIAFENQINRYEYIAPVSGRYRFDCTNRTDGYNVQIRMFDANGNRVLREDNAGTIELTKGSKYSVEVEYSTGLCSYTLNIGVPNEPQKLDAGNVSVAGRIGFVDQENEYQYTPSSSGTYKVSAVSRTNDYNVQIYVYDSNNNRLMREHNEGQVQLETGVLYKIWYCYAGELCDYTVSIVKQ